MHKLILNINNKRFSDINYTLNNNIQIPYYNSLYAIYSLRYNNLLLICLHPYKLIVDILLKPFEAYNAHQHNSRKN